MSTQMQAQLKDLGFTLRFPHYNMGEDLISVGEDDKPVPNELREARSWDDIRNAMENMV